ncbi:hypothetical protein G7Y79_00097g101370 [Physcia stellaris]|nr:hypothetical protein G7Y79_00097g101370 [Physcia stellaris]
MPLPDTDQIVHFYNHLTTSIVPGPNNVSYFLALFLLPTSLLIPPSILSHRVLYSLFLPIIYALQLRSWRQMGGIDVISVNLTLWSLTLLALKDPRRDFRRIHTIKRQPSPKFISDRKNPEDEIQSETLEEPYPQTLRPRISWVGTLVLSIRLTNWKLNDPAHDAHLPPPNTASRRTFALYAFRQIITGYLILDLTSSYAHLDPYFHSPLPISSPLPSLSPSFFNPSSPLPVILQIILPRLLRTTILASQIYALIPCLFHLPVLPAIGLNYLFPTLLPDEWSPHTWPSFFGPFSAVSRHGLKGLWGQWWHQMSRQVVSTPGRSLADALGLENGGREGKRGWQGWARWALVTVSAFGFSGIVHMGLIPPKPLNTGMGAMEMRLWIGAFFWVQVLGFGLEVLGAQAWGYFFPGIGTERRAMRMGVLVWVIAWLCVSLPLIVPPFRELGYWRVWPMPVSVVQGVVGRGWVMWA